MSPEYKIYINPDSAQQFEQFIASIGAELVAGPRRVPKDYSEKIESLS